MLTLNASGVFIFSEWVGTKNKKKLMPNNVYEGTWLNDKRNGTGKSTSSNGDVYEGKFNVDDDDDEDDDDNWADFDDDDDDDEDEVAVEEEDEDDDVDEVDEEGLCFDESEVDSCKVEKDSDRHFESARTGKGVIRCANGDVYEGSWIRNSKEKCGVYRTANGDAFKGNWVKNCKLGPRLFRYANGDVLKGKWVMLILNFLLCFV